MNKPREEEKEISKELTMDLEKNKPKWEKEFDKFISDNEVRWEGSNVGDVKYTAIPLLKIFISALLSSQLKEVLEVIESKRKQELDRNQLHDELYHFASGTIQGYNQALDDLKAEVEKLV